MRSVRSRWVGPASATTLARGELYPVRSAPSACPADHGCERDFPCTRNPHLALASLHQHRGLHRRAAWKRRKVRTNTHGSFELDDITHDDGVSAVHRSTQGQRGAWKIQRSGKGYVAIDGGVLRIAAVLIEQDARWNSRGGRRCGSGKRHISRSVELGRAAARDVKRYAVAAQVGGI